MKKTVLVSALFLALVFLYAGGESMACGMKDQSLVSKLSGMGVKDSDGKDLGVIVDYMRDPTSRAAFVVLTYGTDEEFGGGKRMVAVPFNLLSCGEQDCTLNFAREELDFAPTFTSKEDFVEQKMAWDVYRYFGLHPYWTDEETMKTEMAPDIQGEHEDY
jgi:hypothetical protein